MLDSIFGRATLNESDSVDMALQSIRRHLGMEVAYISEFVDERAVFRSVDAPGLESLIKVGDSHALDDVYCRHIMAGRLPELMADTADYPLAQSLPITAATPIGSHMSVPIRDSEGSAFGMFCCLSPYPNHTLNERDLNVMRVFADMAGHQVLKQRDGERALAERRGMIEQVIDRREFAFAFQPICDLATDRVKGFEALCRFQGMPYRTPDRWFADAVAVGMGVALECAAIRHALGGLSELGEGVYVSVNASSESILSDGFAALFDAAPLGRVMIELTEHAQVEDYEALLAALAPLRAGGARLAIDDAGAGFAGLQHMVQLRPDVIKLDLALTRSIDTDPAKRALAAALIYFGSETGCAILAEGIETESECAVLRGLGVGLGQGYFLGRPMALAAAVDWRERAVG